MGFFLFLSVLSSAILNSSVTENPKDNHTEDKEAVCACVCVRVKLCSNELSVGVRKWEDGPTRPDGNKSSSGTREEVTGQTRAK